MVPNDDILPETTTMGALIELVTLRLSYCIAQIYQQLGEAAFRGCVVAKDGGESGITQWFGEALPECLAGAVVVAQPKEN